MNIKKLVLIILLIVIIVVIVMIVMMMSSTKKIMYYQNYTISLIDVANDSVLIRGGVGGASGIGQDGFDYSIEDNILYLTIYQQSMFAKPPLNGMIDIQLNEDFSSLTDIYLVGPKDDIIKIWSRSEEGPE